MAARKQHKGVCGFCGRESTKGGLTRHLASCAARKDAVQTADAGSRGAATLIHLRVQDDHRAEFWLDLEINGSAALRDLDSYLRAIWLECCGHMSMFSEGGWGEGDELPMDARIDRMLKPGAELVHIYDFGESSETLIKSVSAREGKPASDRPIILMSRNKPPGYVCSECDRSAVRACPGCSLFGNLAGGVFCESHAETHTCEWMEFGDEEAPPLLQNSPRVGMCGYDGPAEPPY